MVSFRSHLIFHLTARFDDGFLFDEKFYMERTMIHEPDFK